MNIFNNIKQQLKNYFTENNSSLNFAIKNKNNEIGSTGLDFSQGLIYDDYNNKWQFDSYIKIVEEMRKGDSQVKASLKAIKLPLLTANWVITQDEEANDEIKEFIEKALFEDLEIPFEEFLNEALAYLEFGFYYFEKVFKQTDDGRIIWKKFASRKPSAHYKWITDNGKGDGVNKNTGVTQLLPSSETPQGEEIKDTQPQIPMSKLILFTNEKEGENYEGNSILRPAYMHWDMKKLCYKIQIISIERHGVGVPVLKLPKITNETEFTRASQMLENYRSNEKSYMIMKEDWEFDIKSPSGGGKESDIKNSIEHHNRMILMNVLAPFLDLGSQASGSYALGETQMSFFLNSLQNIGKYVASVINKAIKELVIINYGEQEYYPKLNVTEIGNIDKQLIMNAITTGVNSGIIIVDEKLRDWVRENMNLPEEDKQEIDEIQNQKQDDKQMEGEISENQLVKKNISSVLKSQKEKKKQEIKSVREAYFAEKKTLDKEKIFQKSITAHEKELERVWKEKYLNEIENTEKKLKEFLIENYNKAKLENASGIKVISTNGNTMIMNIMKKGIKDIMEKLKKKFNNKSFADNLMNESAKFAKKSYSEMKKTKEFVDVAVTQGQVNSFLAGHISNVNGFIFNEGRRITERLIDNFSQKTSINLVLKQTKKIKMNRNITKLSVVTHPRALFKNIIFDNAQKEGIKKFKVLVPDFKIKEINPSGAIAGVLFGIYTYQQLNNKGDTKNNANVIAGMGIHHGDYSYAYPIYDEDIEEETQISEEQRQEFLKQLEIIKAEQEFEKEKINN